MSLFPLSHCKEVEGVVSFKSPALNKRIQYEKEWDIRHHEGIVQLRPPTLEAVI